MRQELIIIALLGSLFGCSDNGVLLAPDPVDLRRSGPSANAVRKLIYVASERQSCTGVAPMMCLQVREQETEPWRLHYEEIVGFTHQSGIEYRLRILEDRLPNPPADSSSTRWFLDLVVEQRVVNQ